jgi:hypothetical protein
MPVERHDHFLQIEKTLALQRSHLTQRTNCDDPANYFHKIVRCLCQTEKSLGGQAMKFRWSYFFIVSAGLIAITVGYLAKRSQLESGYASIGKTSVFIKASVRGTAGRPVKNARISVFDPIQQTLGMTDSNGHFETTVSLTSGKAVVLQADGIAFQMRRDILVPRSLSYQTSVFFDMAEVHEGNATLLSSSNAHSTSLAPKPTPTPIKPTLVTDFSRLNRSPDIVLSLENLLSEASLARDEPSDYTLGCKTLEVTPELHQCEKTAKDGFQYSFLLKALPTTLPEAQAWLEELEEAKFEKLSEKIESTERVFVIRHGGHVVEGFVDGYPLRVWKEKKRSNIYRADPRFDQLKKRKVDLTVVTETGQVFQKSLAWPPRKKVIITRIPKKTNSRLSRR